MVNTNLLNNYVFQLLGTLTTAGTTVAISTEKETGAVVSFTDAYIVMTNLNGTKIERMKATAAAGTLTISIRGLPKDQSMTPDATLYKNWTDGTIVYVTVLAQNYATLQDENAWTGVNTWAAASTFNALVTINSPFVVAGTTSYIKFPELTTVQRLALTPSNSIMVYDTTLGLFYQYKGGAWASVDTGTATPNGSLLIAGVYQTSTNAQTDALTTVGSTGALLVTSQDYIPVSNKSTLSNNDKLVIYDSDASNNKKGVLISTINTQVSPSALSDNSLYPSEDITAGNAVYVENTVSDTLATSAQNVGDVTGNTRFAIKSFGTGATSNTITLNLAKAATPTQTLGIRIETDSAGSPSGTLAHANATGTLSQIYLTTGLVKTVVTLAGNISIAAGTKVWIVGFQGTYGSETIDAVNYYKVGYSTRNTTTRYEKLWNGSAWGATSNKSFYYDSTTSVSSPVTDSNGQTMATTSSGTVDYGNFISVNVNSYLSGVNRATGVTGTRCRVFSTTGSGATTYSSVIATSTTLSGDKFIFNNVLLTAGTYYVITIDASGGSYTRYYNSAGSTYPVVATDITYVNFADSGNINTGTTEWHLIQSIETVPYTTGQGALAGPMIAKTDATYSYKSNVYGIARQTVLTGAAVIPVIISGTTTLLTGLTPGSLYYITNTPGAVSTTAGTNTAIVGRAIQSNELLILSGAGTDTLATPITMANNTVYTAATDGMVVARGGTTTGLSIIGYADLIDGATTVIARTGTNVSMSGEMSITYPVRRGYMYKVNVTGTNSSFGAGAFYPFMRN